MIINHLLTGMILQVHTKALVKMTFPFPKVGYVRFFYIFLEGTTYHFQELIHHFVHAYTPKIKKNNPT